MGSTRRTVPVGGLLHRSCTADQDRMTSRRCMANEALLCSSMVCQLVQKHLFRALSGQAQPLTCDEEVTVEDGTMWDVVVSKPGDAAAAGALTEACGDRGNAPPERMPASDSRCCAGDGSSSGAPASPDAAE